MPGHSRSKNGVASLAYVPGIHAYGFFKESGLSDLLATSPTDASRHFFICFCRNASVRPQARSVASLLKLGRSSLLKACWALV